jgi:hypothetical protein
MFIAPPAGTMNGSTLTNRFTANSVIVAGMWLFVSPVTQTDVQPTALGHVGVGILEHIEEWEHIEE